MQGTTPSGIFLKFHIKKYSPRLILTAVALLRAHSGVAPITQPHNGLTILTPVMWMGNFSNLCIMPSDRALSPRQSLLTLRSKNKMKRSLRALLLLVGLVGTYAYAAIPRITPPHEIGPMPWCPPSHPNCDA